MNPEVIIEFNTTPRPPPKLAQIPIIKTNKVVPIINNHTVIYVDRNSDCMGIPGWLVCLIIFVEFAAICVIIALYGK